MNDASKLSNAAPPALLSAWLEQSHDLLVVTDQAGQIVWANQRFQRATESEPRAANLLQLPLPGSDADTTRSVVQQILQAGLLIRDTELCLRGAAGTALWVRADTTRVDGHILWTLQDTTASRELATQALRQSELLDLVQEFGRLGVWEREIPSGIGRWDRHVFGFWGMQPTAGTPNYADAIERIHPDDRAASMYEQSTQQAGRYSQRYRVIQPGGGTRWIHSQWEVKNSPEGKPVRTLGIMVDDTEVYELARSLDSTSAQLKLAVELADIVIWRHDLKSNRLQFNAHGYTVLDIEPRPEGLALDEMRALIHPDDLERVRVSARAALSADKPTDIQARHRRADGSWRDLLTRRVVERSATGEAVAFVGVALDVTAQHATLAALHQASERSALITRSAGIGTWESAGLDNTHALWDEQMFHLRGMTPRREALTRQERLALVHPEDVERVLDSYANRGTAALPGAYEFRVLLPDGSYRWLASRSAAVFDTDGRAVRRVGVNWDVTEAKTAELARQKTLLAERESQAKSQFLSRMSHELRTPLNAMLGFAQLLEIDQRHPLAPAQRPWVGQIQQAGWHLLEMINDVLDLSRIESGNLRLQPTTLDLPELVAATIALVTSDALRREIRISQDLAPGTAGIIGDATRVKQILTNLLSNAVKYNADAGRVHIASRLVAPDVVEIAVTDTGMGMTPAQMDELFKPFNRLGRERSALQGTGIGLVISRRLAELMGGSIGVKSFPGEGSSFTLRLPKAINPDTVRSNLDKLETQPAEYHRRIVHYVEDNETNVEVMRGILAQREQVQMEVSVTGLDGLAAVRAKRPHLILLDMHLPDISGLELLRHFKADPETAAIPVIVVSADALGPQIDAALAAGATRYLTKPVDVGELLAALDGLLDRMDTGFS